MSEKRGAGFSTPPVPLLRRLSPHTAPSRCIPPRARRTTRAAPGAHASVASGRGVLCDARVCGCVHHAHPNHSCARGTVRATAAAAPARTAAAAHSPARQPAALPLPPPPHTRQRAQRACALARRGALVQRRSVYTPGWSICSRDCHAAPAALWPPRLAYISAVLRGRLSCRSSACEEYAACKERCARADRRQLRSRAAGAAL